MQIFCARLFGGFLTAICHLAERDSSWQSNFDLILLVILYIELKKNIFKRTRSLRPKPVLLDGSQNSENNHKSISLAAVRQVVIGYEYSRLWQKKFPVFLNHPVDLLILKSTNYHSHSLFRRTPIASFRKVH